MLDRGKMGGSILITSFHLYFLKLHSYNYTLPPLIRRRNRGVIFLFIHPLHSFPRYFWGKSSARAGSLVRGRPWVCSVWPRVGIGSYQSGPVLALGLFGLAPGLSWVCSAWPKVTKICSVWPIPEFGSVRSEPACP